MVPRPPDRDVRRHRGHRLTLFELSEEVEARYVDGKYVPVTQLPSAKRRGPQPAGDWTYTRHFPSGRLSLRASSPYSHADWERQWRESKPGELRAKLAGIVKELEAEAGTIAKLVEEGERRVELERRRWAAQQEQWRREEAERRRVQNIQESRQQLFEIIEAWGVAKRIEAFFEDAEHRATGLGDEESQEFLERLRRARTLLGGTDALQRFRAWKAADER